MLDPDNVTKLNSLTGIVKSGGMVNAFKSIVSSEKYESDNVTETYNTFNNLVLLTHI